MIGGNVIDSLACLFILNLLQSVSMVIHLIIGGKEKFPYIKLLRINYLDKISIL